MTPRFTFDNDDRIPVEGSADQRELLRLARAVRGELLQRVEDVGCMSPSEMSEFLDSVDKLQDLHVWASLHDDRVAFFRGKYQQTSWCDD
jgi:hypothetical protein